MRIDVTFEQADMEIRPAFDTTISMDGGGGVVFVPDVSEDGLLSWTNNGNLLNPEPVNILGKEGKSGADGYSPVRGIDYWTDADKTQMVADVIAALPVYNGEVVE